MQDTVLRILGLLHLLYKHVLGVCLSTLRNFVVQYARYKTSNAEFPPDYAYIPTGRRIFLNALSCMRIRAYKATIAHAMVIYSPF